MLKIDRAARGAVLPLAAAAVAATGAAAAPAAPTTPSPTTSPAATPVPTVIPTPTATPAPAGHNVLAAGPALQTARTTLPSVPRSGRIVRVLDRHLTLVSGHTVTVRARTTTVPVHVELRVGRHGRVVDAANVAPGSRFRLQGRAASGDALWLRTRRTDGGKARSWVSVGTVRGMRPALASWYGPGFYGHRTACGQTLTVGLRGVAHKTLPCGTRLTLHYRGRTTTATVVDRGPYSGSREFDLTGATARALGFGAVGQVWVSHR